MKQAIKGHCFPHSLFLLATQQTAVSAPMHQALRALSVHMCSLCLLTFQTSTCFRLETVSSGWSRDFEEGAYWRSDLQRLIFSSLDSNKTLNLASTLAIKGVTFSLNISGSQSCCIFKNSCFVFNWFDSYLVLKQATKRSHLINKWWVRLYFCCIFVLLVKKNTQKGLPLLLAVCFAHFCAARPPKAQQWDTSATMIHNIHWLILTGDLSCISYILFLFPAV